MYAEIHDTTLIQYPYGFQELQIENPSTNFGNNTDVAYWFPNTDTATQKGYTLVDVVTAPQPTYDAAHQTCVLGSKPILVNGVWTLEWTVTDFTPEQQAEYDANIKEQNKSQAMQLLAATDWTTLPDVSNPDVSNPYLTNATQFAIYRNKVRAIAVNPPTSPATFPMTPVERWSA